MAQDQVEVVAEHRVAVAVDREARRNLPEAFDEPGAAHAARREVVVALVHGIDQQMPRGCHAPMVRDPGARRRRRIAMAGIGARLPS